MQVPLQLSFRDIPEARREEIEERVRRRAEKLERYFDPIVSCRVAIERPHQFERSGNPYRVRVDVSVPGGHEVVVRKEPGDHDLHADLLTVVNGAFEAVERQLATVVERMRGEVKTHEEPRALVLRVFRDDGYGFLETEDGRDVYFHRNAVADDAFERLTPGTGVRFEETMGEMGPQATTVQIVDKPGVAAAVVPERAIEEPLGWEEELG
jgi:cold shock CspA family protein